LKGLIFLEKEPCYQAQLEEALSKNRVNHPYHYAGDGGLEAIDVIAAFTADLNGRMAFDIGNALKYICRFNKKNGVEDLEKAIWYLNDAITNKKEN
jgi:hypothetical protein